MISKNLIYAYLDPRNGLIRYIGKSTIGLDRPKNFHAHGQHCGNWIKNLTTDNLEPEILILEELSDNASIEEINEAEIFHISYWRFLGANLTNLTVGGDGIPGLKHSEETKLKMSKAAKGKPKSPEHIAKIAKLRLGKVPWNKGLKTGPLPEEVKLKLSKAQKGKPHKRGWKLSEEVRSKMSLARKGHLVSEETKKRISEAQKGKEVPLERRKRISETIKRYYNEHGTDHLKEGHLKNRNL